MKREDEYYEKWLNTLKATPPLLDGPDELTAAIMQRVSRTPSKRSQRISFISSWMSIVAASILLCLLIGETCLAPVSAPMEEPGRLMWKITSPLPDNWEAMSRFEKRGYVSSVFREKELQRMRKVRILEYRVKNQTKSISYEKK